MRTDEPGWFPDPQGGRQVRFWDGEDWTSYVQPLPPPAEVRHGPATALADYPYLTTAQLAPAREPRLVDHWGASPATVTDPLGAAPAGPGPRPPRQRSGLGAWIAVGVVAVIAVVVGVVIALRSPASPLTDPETTEATTAVVTPGDEADLAVPAGGSATFTLEVPATGHYLVQVTGDGDPIAALQQDGTEIWRGDDRGAELASLLGGTWSDPVGLLSLDAGTYQVQVTDRNAQPDRVTLRIDPVDTVPLQPGTTQQVDIGYDDVTVLQVDLPDAGEATLDVRATSGSDDPWLFHFLAGRPTVVDDRGSQAAADIGGAEMDPLLTETFPAGTTLLVLAEYEGNTTTVEVTLTLE